MTADHVPETGDLLFLAEYAPREPERSDQSADALFTLFAALSSRIGFDHQRDSERAQLLESIRR